MFPFNDPKLQQRKHDCLDVKIITGPNKRNPVSE